MNSEQRCETTISGFFFSWNSFLFFLPRLHAFTLGKMSIREIGSECSSLAVEKRRKARTKPEIAISWKSARVARRPLYTFLERRQRLWMGSLPPLCFTFRVLRRVYGIVLRKPIHSQVPFSRDNSNSNKIEGCFVVGNKNHIFKTFTQSFLLPVIASQTDRYT